MRIIFQFDVLVRARQLCGYWIVRKRMQGGGCFDRYKRSMGESQNSIYTGVVKKWKLYCDRIGRWAVT